MKPFQAQSYYELLEVPVSATTEQIRRAYERLCAQYADDQVALYGLADEGSASALRARLLEAMEILTDDDLRIEYDKDLGLPPRQQPQPNIDEQEASPAQLAMNDLLTGADRALQSTHPYVPFAYVTPPRPPISVFDAQPPPPAVVPAPLAPVMTPTPPPPPAISSAPATGLPMPPLPSMVEAAAPPPVAAEVAAPIAVALPVAGPSAPPPPVPSAPAPAPSAPPPAASAPAPVPSAPAPTTSPPRPTASQAPELAETAAIAEAESALARVSLSVNASREARASAPRPKAPDVPTDAEFNGELLRKVRTAVGLSLQQISDRTRISVRHLENIEADRYSGLPAPVYLRGILMSLSRELGLDGLRVSKSYIALVEKAKG